MFARARTRSQRPRTIAVPMKDRQLQRFTRIGRTVVAGIARLASRLEISMSLSSWIVFGLIAGFMARRIVNEGRRHRRHSAWNRGFDRRWV
jgi:hypothetical protein